MPNAAAMPKIIAALIATTAAAMPITNSGRAAIDVQIEHHADGDEEQAEQDRAERLDIRLELVPIGRVGEHHAGDERAERGRQMQRLHHRRRGEHGEQARPRRTARARPSPPISRNSGLMT